MTCKFCGSSNADAAKFCNTCGKPIKKESNIKLVALLMGLFTVVLFLVAIVIVLGKNGSISFGNGNTSRTIMIYMDGSNLESQSSIATSEINSINPSLIDLEYVHIYLYTGGTERWHNFVSSDENAIYELKKEGFVKVKSYPKENMGDAKTLSTFINYVYSNSKTNKYDLVFYNHGGAIDGAIYDDFTNDNLKLNEFSNALRATPFNSRNKLELVIFRTCLNGTIEVGNAFKNYADYMVASEEVTNGQTNRSVLNFVNDIKRTDSATDVGMRFINAYSDQMKLIDPNSYGSDPMYAIWNLNNLDELITQTDIFFKGIDSTKYYNDIVRERGKLFQFANAYADDPNYDMVDLYTLVNNLAPYSTVKPDRFNSAFNKVVFYNWSKIIPEAKGISIYFPFNGVKNAQDYFMSTYDSISVSKNYTAFISNVKDNSRSYKSTSFKKNLINDSTIGSEGTVEAGKEFVLELSEDEANDYATSLYIIFKKEDDGKFTLIYSSNDTKLEKNKIITKTKNKLIRAPKEEGGYFYLPIIERVSEKKTTQFFLPILTYMDDEKYLSDNATAYIGYDKDKNPYVEMAVIDPTKRHVICFTDSEDCKELEKSTKEVTGQGGIVANFDDYNTYTILSSHYKILDENGNYTSNWDNEGIIQGYEFTRKNDLEEGEDFGNMMDLETASLSDDDDYYCVFKIRDIYGNEYYTKLFSLK